MGQEFFGVEQQGIVLGELLQFRFRLITYWVVDSDKSHQLAFDIIIVN